MIEKLEEYIGRWIIGIGLALVFVVAVAILLLLGGDSEPASTVIPGVVS